MAIPKKRTTGRIARFRLPEAGNIPIPRLLRERHPEYAEAFKKTAQYRELLNLYFGKLDRFISEVESRFRKVEIKVREVGGRSTQGHVPVLVLPVRPNIFIPKELKERHPEYGVAFDNILRHADQVNHILARSFWSIKGLSRKLGGGPAGASDGVFAVLPDPPKFDTKRHPEYARAWAEVQRYYHEITRQLTSVRSILRELDAQVRYLETSIPEEASVLRLAALEILAEVEAGIAALATAAASLEASTGVGFEIGGVAIGGATFGVAGATFGVADTFSTGYGSGVISSGAALTGGTFSTGFGYIEILTTPVLTSGVFSTGTGRANIDILVTAGLNSRGVGLAPMSILSEVLFRASAERVSLHAVVDVDFNSGTYAICTASAAISAVTDFLVSTGEFVYISANTDVNAGVFSTGYGSLLAGADASVSSQASGIGTGLLSITGLALFDPSSIGMGYGLLGVEASTAFDSLTQAIRFADAHIAASGSFNSATTTTTLAELAALGNSTVIARSHATGFGSTHVSALSLFGCGSEAVGYASIVADANTGTQAWASGTGQAFISTVNNTDSQAGATAVGIASMAAEGHSGVGADAEGVGAASINTANSSNAEAETVAVGGAFMSAQGSSNVSIDTTWELNEAPSTPGTLSYSNLDHDSVRVAWGASSDPDGDPVVYDIEYRENGTSTWIRDRTGETATYEYIYGLDSKTTYDVRVRASDGELYSGWRYGYSLFTTANQAPSTPGTITAGSITETTVRVYWGASSDPEGDSVTYEVAYRESGTTTWIEDVTGEDMTSEYISGLSPGTSYDIRVRAYDGEDYSSWREQTNVFTTDANQAPSMPGTISVSNVTASSATVSWGASSDPDGDPITYTVQWRTNNYSLWISGYFSSSTTTSTSLELTGLEEDRTYDVRVRSSDGELSSSYRQSDDLFTTASSSVSDTAPMSVTASINVDIATEDNALAFSGHSYSGDQSSITQDPTTPAPNCRLVCDQNSNEVLFSGSNSGQIEHLGSGQYRTKGTGLSYFAAVNGLQGNCSVVWEATDGSGTSYTSPALFYA